jgi:hypothetical protein
LAGERKKASSGSSTPRMRLGPQGDKGAKPAPFYECPEPNIPAAWYCGTACPAGTCKTLTIFHDGTHGLSPGTDGSNPRPSSGEGANSTPRVRGAACYGVGIIGTADLELKLLELSTRVRGTGGRRVTRH